MVKYTRSTPEDKQGFADLAVSFISSAITDLTEIKEDIKNGPNVMVGLKRIKYSLGEAIKKLQRAHSLSLLLPVDVPLKSKKR